MNTILLFGVFARIGLFGFGGGVAMLPMIFQSVQEFEFMTRHEFSDLVALSQITPGPIAVNAATYVGFENLGVWGAVVATLGVALPSFIMIVVVMKIIDRYNKSRVIQGIFVGIRPATVGLIGTAVIFVAETSLFTGAEIQWIPCAICLVTIVLAGKWRMNPLLLALAMGAVGALLCI